MYKKQTVILVVTLLIIVTISNAQSGGNFTLSKSSIDAGGGATEGGNFSIVSTIGQVDASTKISAGDFILTGGFWASEINNDVIFKNGFE